MLYMDTITSTEFRKQYARLERTVEVTAGGRPIGVWIPTTPAQPLVPQDSALTQEEFRRLHENRPVFTPVTKPAPKPKR